MNDRPSQRQAPSMGPAGLCSQCVHVQLVQNSRGSTFFLCRLSFSDPRFARYPPLPVLSCAGFVPCERESERTP
jgi:hypothetical protein